MLPGMGQIATIHLCLFKRGLTPVFWGCRPSRVPTWLAELIRQAGDIELNPGPLDSLQHHSSNTPRSPPPPKLTPPHQNCHQNSRNTPPILSPHHIKGKETLTIIQLNINGMRNKFEELKTLIDSHNADIIVLQESKLQPGNNTPHINGFTTIRKIRT